VLDLATYSKKVNSVLTDVRNCGRLAKMSDEIRISDIRNYYGQLKIKSKDGSFFWGIEDWSGGPDWEEIPEYLYNALRKHEQE
jgi:hypothetical protein